MAGGRRLRQTVRAVILCFLLVVGLLLAAPAALADTGGAAPQAKWTLMVYMCGDNNLERWLIHDLDTEMAVTGSNADVQIVALADRAEGYNKADEDWTGTLVFNPTQGMTATPANAVADWGELDMGSPQTLVDFVQWTRANYPADHYALLFWDHGWGWWPKYSMEDDTSNDSLDQDEIRDAMQTLYGVDMVGMDTCIGQMIEVQATFRGFADAFAGSQDAIGYSGFNYDRIVTGLQADPTMSAGDLAKLAASSMRTDHDRWTLASSAVALDERWDTLAYRVDMWSQMLQAGLHRFRRQYEAAREHTAYPIFGDATNRDLYDAAHEIRIRVSSPAIRRHCTYVMRAVKAVTLKEWSTAAEGDLHGIGIFWPSTPAPPHAGSTSWDWWDFPYYSTQLEFTRMTAWEDFLIYWGRRPHNAIAAATTRNTRRRPCARRPTRPSFCRRSTSRCLSRASTTHPTPRLSRRW